MAESYGLKIKRNSTVLQLDNSYRNYFLYSKQTHVLNTRIGGYYAKDIDLPPNAVVALSTQDGWVQYHHQRVERGLRVYRITSYWVSTVTVYIFVPDRVGPGGEYGLKLRSPNGVVTFNSNDPIMDVKGSWPATPWIIGGDGVKSELFPAAAKPYAVVILCEGRYWNSSGGTPEHPGSWSVTEFFVNSTTTGMSFRQYSTYGSGDLTPPEGYNGTVRGIVINTDRL